jgi:hypothetical protein
MKNDASKEDSDRKILIKKYKLKTDEETEYCIQGVRKYYLINENNEWILYI